MKHLILIIFFSFLIPVLINAQTSDSIKKNAAEVASKSAIQADSIKQVDLVDIMVELFKIKNSQQKRDNRKVRFSLFPSTSSTSGDKAVFTSFNASFILGDNKNTNVSTIFFVPYIGIGGQYGFQIQPNIWLRKNSWNFTGEYFILNYPQNTWGLGGNTPDSNKTMIDYNHFRIHQNILKGIFPHLAIGLGYAYDNHNHIDVEETVTGDSIQKFMPEDKNYTVSSGITIPIIYDNRRNSMNAQQGFMSSLTYSFYDPVLGSDSSWQSVFFDVRKYFPIPTKKVSILAFRAYYWSILSGNPPYLDLPANRWEPIQGSSSRGIRQNRYRSNAILYFESEYRFGITANGLLGGVVFASVTSASQYNTQNFLYWHPAAGAGVRVKFNKYSRTNVTLDFGVSKGFFNVYLNIGEAF